MKPHVILACAATAMLTACASVGPSAHPSEALHVSGFSPVASIALPINFCQGAAASERARLQTAGFDAPSLERMTSSSLQQCNVMWAASRDKTATFQIAMR